MAGAWRPADVPALMPIEVGRLEVKVRVGLWQVLHHGPVRRQAA
jgi:hypothetical protein